MGAAKKSVVEKRRNEILNIVEERDFFTVKSLASLLKTSDITIRRDIGALGGELTVISGIVMKKENCGGIDKKYHADIEKYAYEEEKRLIGRYAASLVSPGDTVAIDIGTTTEYLIKYFPDNIDIFVICNALNIVNELSKKDINKILMCGGNFMPSTQTFDSPEFLKTIEKYRVTKAFMSAAGFSAKMGVTCFNAHEIAYKQMIMKLSIEKILLFDSSKYQKVRPICFAEARDFTKIITTAEFDSGDAELLGSCGSEYIKIDKKEKE